MGKALVLAGVAAVALAVLLVAVLDTGEMETGKAVALERGASAPAGETERALAPAAVDAPAAAPAAERQAVAPAPDGGLPPMDDDEREMLRWIEGRVVIPEGTPADEELFVVGMGRRFDDGSWHRARVQPDGGFRVAVLRRGRLSVGLDVAGRYAYLESPYRFRPGDRPRRIVDPPDVRIVARDGSEAEQLGEELDEIVLEPELGGRIEGRIVVPPGSDADVTSRERMTVRLESTTPRITRGTRLLCELDAAGRFEVNAVPPDTVFRLAVESDSFPQADETFRGPSRGQTHRLQLDLASGPLVAVRVVDERGDPVEGVYVRIETKSGLSAELSKLATTNADGRVLLAVTAGSLVVRLNHVDGRKLDEELGQVETDREVELVLPEGDVVSGRVVTADGEPAPRALVSARDADGDLLAQATAGSEGHFRLLGLPEGVLDVLARAGEDAEPAWGAVRDVRAGAVIDVVLHPPSRVLGRAFDDTGSPMRRFTVVAVPADHRAGRAAAVETVRERVRGDDGRFELPLAPGPWQVFAESHRHGLSELVGLDLSEGDAEVTFTLPRGAELHGVVLDPAREPLRGAKLTAVPRDGGNTPPFEYDERHVTERTARDGSFDLRGIPPGPVRLLVAAEGKPVTERLDLDLGPGEVREGLEIVLGEPGRIAGVLDAGVTSRAGRRIAIEPRSTVTSAITDDEGRFAVDDLPPGEYELQLRPDFGGGGAGDPHYARTTVTVAVRAGETTEVTLGAPARPLIRVEGRVVRAGEGVAGVPLAAELGDAEARAVTGDDGRFELDLTGPGRWTFEVGRAFDGSLVRLARDVPDAPVVALELELPAGAIRGSLVGAGEQRFEVVLLPDVPHPRFGDRRTCWSRTDGTFSFEGVAPGLWSLRAVERSGRLAPAAPTTHAIALVEHVEVTDAGPVELEVVLTPAGTVAGTAYDASGFPLVNERVWIETAGGVRLAPSYSRTNADGSFELEGIPGGTFTLALAADGGTVRRPVEVVAGHTARADVELE